MYTKALLPILSLTVALPAMMTTTVDAASEEAIKAAWIERIERNGESSVRQEIHNIAMAQEGIEHIDNAVSVLKDKIGIASKVYAQKITAAAMANSVAQQAMAALTSLVSNGYTGDVNLIASIALLRAKADMAKEEASQASQKLRIEQRAHAEAYQELVQANQRAQRRTYRTIKSLGLRQ